MTNLILSICYCTRSIGVVDDPAPGCTMHLTSQMLSHGGQSWSQRGRRSLFEVSPRAVRVHVGVVADIGLHRLARL